LHRTLCKRLYMAINGIGLLKITEEMSAFRNDHVVEGGTFRGVGVDVGV